jgi:hypothetical protein
MQTENHRRSGNRRLALFVTLLALLLLFAVPALAITYGEPDGDDHP